MGTNCWACWYGLVIAIALLVLLSLGGCQSAAFINAKSGLGADEVHLKYDRVGGTYTAEATIRWEGMVGDGRVVDVVK